MPKGGSGGNGGQVTVTNYATIATTGDYSLGILAQSAGGGGGSAHSTSAAFQSMGGSGGSGGNAAAATVNNYAAISTTKDDPAHVGGDVGDGFDNGYSGFGLGHSGGILR